MQIYSNVCDQYSRKTCQFTKHEPYGGGGSTLTVSLTVRYVFFLLMTSLRADAEISIFGEICTPGAGGIGWYRAKVLMALKIHWVCLVQLLCINMVMTTKRVTKRTNNWRTLP